MHTINMPGFTAEASLYKTNRRNQSAGTFLEIIEGILPAQPVRPWPVDVVYNLRWLIPLSQVNQNLGLAGQIRNWAGFEFFGRS